MRFRFAAKDSREAALLGELALRADAFFETAVNRLTEGGGSGVKSRVDRARLERELGGALSRVSPSLLVEIDAFEGGKISVALVPADDAGLEPLLARVLARAPAASGIEFVRYRAERNQDEALEEVRERFGVDFSRARVRIGFSRGHLLEVVVHSSAVSSSSDESRLDAANALVAYLLGDELFDDWIGAVDIVPAPREGPLKLLASGARDPTLSLSEALPAVEAAIRAVYAELPAAPYRAFCAEAKWTLLEAEPGAELDYPEQDDIALKSTALPEAMKCFLERGRFSSKRFSRHGECFAYVKVEANDHSADARHELRVALEEAIGRALVGAAVGCVVGAGLGVRYVYIDVVLENVQRGVGVIRETLQTLDVDERSWVLFCDATLSHEWIGIWDHTPPPPER